MSEPARPDRYRSFSGLDCAGDALAVLQRVRRLIDRPQPPGPFWQHFAARLARMGEPGQGDALYLVCSHVYYIEELFEAESDADGLALLARIEAECC